MFQLNDTAASHHGDVYTRDAVTLQKRIVYSTCKTLP